MVSAPLSLRMQTPQSTAYTISDIAVTYPGDVQFEPLSLDTVKTTVKRSRRGKRGNGLLLCPWPGCTHTTQQKSNLKTHYLRHTGDKPYACPHFTDDEGVVVRCTFKTGDPACLTRHRKSTHDYAPPPRGARAECTDALKLGPATPKAKGKGKARDGRHHPYARSSKTEKDSTLSELFEVVATEQASTKMEHVPISLYFTNSPSASASDLDNWAIYPPASAAMTAIAAQPSEQGQATFPSNVDCSIFDFNCPPLPVAAANAPFTMDDLFQLADANLPAGLTSEFSEGSTLTDLYADYQWTPQDQLGGLSPSEALLFDTSYLSTSPLPGNTDEALLALFGSSPGGSTFVPTFSSDAASPVPALAFNSTSHISPLLPEELLSSPVTLGFDFSL